ncbi:hypothetical protein, partial [Leuconostoc mesenteroides]|uniref:hypothetical protein n=1 Tax=Leuconostoc mesenteroides TaxID=1245 RepID=UPI002362C4CF
SAVRSVRLILAIYHKYNDKKRLEVDLVAFYRDQLLRYQYVIFGLYLATYLTCITKITFQSRTHYQFLIYHTKRKKSKPMLSLLLIYLDNIKGINYLTATI